MKRAVLLVVMVVTGLGWASSASGQEPAACTIVGTAGDDVLHGTAGDDVICALAGNDNVTAGGGRDVLRGGDGNDYLRGEVGRDVLEGADGADTLLGGSGADQLIGGQGIDLAAYWGQTKPVIATIGDGANDGAARERDDINADVENLSGGKADDFLTGDAGANRLNGDRGNDRLLGGAGRDQLVGGDGDDRLDSADGTHDSLNCGDGSDRFQRDAIDWVPASCETSTGPASGAIQLSPDPVQLGVVTVGQTASQTVTVTNVGDTHLEILAYHIGPIRSFDTWASTGSTCGILLWRGQCRYQLVLTPGAPGDIRTAAEVWSYNRLTNAYDVKSPAITVLATAVAR